jgi:hypothetical protein
VPSAHRFAGAGLAGSAADFGKLIINETEKWANVVMFSGAKTIDQRVRWGSSAVFAAAFAARPVHLRKLPTCCTVQVGGVEANRLCAAAASHPGSQVQGSPLGQPIKTSMSRDRCRSGCDRSCPAAVVISRECKILHSRL